jgi:kumamolisin
MTSHLPLPGSHRPDCPQDRVLGAVPSDTAVEFTAILRRRAELPSELVHGPRHITPDELADRYGADPADVELVRSVFATAGARVREVHGGSRRISATATASVVQRLFGVELHAVRGAHPGTGRPLEHRAHRGELRVPAALDGIVVAVLGLDDRPQARRYLHRPQHPALDEEVDIVFPPPGVRTRRVSYTPPQLATIYGFPAADGVGHTAAILEFGGGFDPDDLSAYFRGLGLEPPQVTAVGVDGMANAAEPDPDGDDGEVALDIEVLGALVPKASILVYFSKFSDKGWVDAVSQAAHATPTPTVLSISWGQTEESWTPAARSAVDAAFADAAALGITICVAAGDRGSGDGDQPPGNPLSTAHVEFPAASPHVLAVGGTTLHADPETGVVQSETVWDVNDATDATGGGVSAVFGLPQWQTGVGVPSCPGTARSGRGVPDVAAVADGNTGYSVRLHGASVTIGGTSAAAPLWAALVCRYAQLLGTRFGLLQPAIYCGAAAGEQAPGMRGITVGDNGAYRAGPGWNACTGLGVPRGVMLLSVLRDYLANAHQAGHHPAAERAELPIRP